MYIHIQVDASVYDDIWKKQFSGVTESKIYNMQALKVYCETGVIKKLLLFSFANSSILTNKKLNGSTFNEKNEFLLLIANYSWKTVMFVRMCTKTHHNRHTHSQNKRRENHARHTILKIATLDQLQRKFSYNHCLIIILLKLRGL